MTKRLLRHMRTHFIAYLALFFALGGIDCSGSGAAEEQRRQPADQESLNPKN
jgi:hypothetical protein